MIEKQMLDLEQGLNKLSQDITTEKQTLDKIVKVFEDAPVYAIKDKGGTVSEYKYFIYPFKGFSLVDYSLYYSLGKYLARFVAKDVEAIVTVESDGIPVASFVAAELGIPLIIAKSFHYNLPCVEFVQQTGYYNRLMYLSRVIEGKKVALVDCMISTGGTIKAMVDAIKTLPGTAISGVYCLNNKNNYGTQQEEICGYEYKYLFNTFVNAQDKVEVTLSRALKEVFWQQIDERFFELAKDCAHFSNFSKNGYQVGALIVSADNFEIVAWGFRRSNIHAEQDALSMLKINCPDWQKREFTLYTTLEPCVYRNGNGHTACADLINEVPQIRWVGIGDTDTADGKINGAGIIKLRDKKHLRLMSERKIMRCENEVMHFL
jgi:adenine phosphoribosyltransferase